jgi:hypothetical protein
VSLSLGGSTRPAPTATVRPVNPRDVLQLQAIRTFPAISVLLSTTPAPAMTRADRGRLQALVERAVTRLGQAARGTHPAPVVEALEQLAAAVVAEPADQALGLFVSPGTQRALRLGVPVADRAVVESSFVTRDLVYALQRTPRHLVLVLSTREARLFDAVNGVLRPAATTAFPHRAERSRRPSASRPHLPTVDLTDFLRQVDRRLGTYRALHPSPIVVVGPADVVARLTGIARNLHRWAGTLTGNHVDASLERLAELTKPVLHDYLSSREAEALALLSSRSSRGRVASGMQQAWLASRTERPEMLAVEHGLFYPAILSPDGHTLTPTNQLDDPQAISDAVDELIEHVLIRGGWVAIVADGQLAEHDGVALALR